MTAWARSLRFGHLRREVPDPFMTAREFRLRIDPRLKTAGEVSANENSDLDEPFSLRSAAGFS